VVKKIYKNNKNISEKVKIGTVNIITEGKHKFLKIEEKRIVVILPITKIKNQEVVILEKQYRPAIDKYIYEIPAGHVEDGEELIHAVKRELSEETGYIPKKISFMFKSYPMPGSNTTMFNFFLAEDLSKGEAHHDADEDIVVKKVKLEKAIEMINSGEIIDLKTIAGILYYNTFLKQKHKHLNK